MQDATSDPVSLASAIVVIIGSLIVWLQSRRHGKTAENTAQTAVEKVQEVHTTLTQNNGGSSVKDQLDRIERRQVQADERAILQDQRFVLLAENVSNNLTSMQNRINRVEEKNVNVTIVDRTAEPGQLDAGDPV